MADESQDMTVAGQVMELLGTYLGPNTARTAVKTFTRKAFGKSVKYLLVKDLPGLCEALRPMLRTLLGNESAEIILDSIKKGVS
jgi:hypothetical protein